MITWGKGPLELNLMFWAKILYSICQMDMYIHFSRQIEWMMMIHTRTIHPLNVEISRYQITTKSNSFKYKHLCLFIYCLLLLPSSWYSECVINYQVEIIWILPLWVVLPFEKRRVHLDFKPRRSRLLSIPINLPLKKARGKKKSQKRKNTKKERINNDTTNKGAFWV